MTETHDILVRAKTVSGKIALSEHQKNNALLKMAEFLIKDCDKILEANKQDVKNATGVISDVMIDRLRLDKSRINDMANGIRKVAELPDPAGRVLSETHHNNGMIIKKVSVPLGVVAIIYESRPNVTSDAAALAFKSGNVCILRSGKDAFRSAFAIVSALRAGLVSAEVDKDYVNLIEDTSRQSAVDLMTASEYIDLLIPRGGKGLIKSCIENATVPIIETGTGICHIYVDKSADFNMALDIIENAKTSRPSVCNAAEVCLVHKDIAADFLPLLKQRLADRSDGRKVELRGDERVLQIIGCVAASSTDFDTEFLDYIMAVSVKDNIEDAIEHITKHSTHHSECIITSDHNAAEYFTSRIDSAAVYVNASTRFTDGGEFGLGCEMGISTQKLHARGPMGLSELNTYKYIISGNGQIRQ